MNGKMHLMDIEAAVRERLTSLCPATYSLTCGPK